MTDKNFTVESNRFLASLQHFCNATLMSAAIQPEVIDNTIFITLCALQPQLLTTTASRFRVIIRPTFVKVGICT